MRTFRITIGGISTPHFTKLFIEGWERKVPDVAICIPSHLDGEGDQIVFRVTTERRKDTADIHSAAHVVGRTIQLGLTYGATYLPDEEQTVAA